MTSASLPFLRTTSAVGILLLDLVVGPARPVQFRQDVDAAGIGFSLRTTLFIQPPAAWVAEACDPWSPIRHCFRWFHRTQRGPMALAASPGSRAGGFRQRDRQLNCSAKT